MAQSVVARTWRSTTPETIEPDLAALWREIGRDTPVARAVMSNLVVFRERGASEAPLEELTGDLPLDAVVARHPSRVIVIEHDRRPSNACPPFAAGIGVVTFGPPQARFGVEQIAVRSACAEASLPSIVRRLIRGDVPTSVWWTGDVSVAPPLDAVVALGRQLVYDSRRWRDVRRGVLTLANRGVDLADVNWRRLTPLRHALVDACRSCGIDEVLPTNVHIAHRAGEEPLAWLAMGWLSARLGWASNEAPRIEPMATRTELLSISFGRASAHVTATLDDRQVLVTEQGATSFTVNVPQETEADAVAAELRNLSHDVCLHDALRALIDRFAASP